MSIELKGAGKGEEKNDLVIKELDEALQIIIDIVKNPGLTEVQKGTLLDLVNETSDESLRNLPKT